MVPHATCNATELLRQHKSVTVQCVKRSVPGAAGLNDTVSSAGLAARDLRSNSSRTGRPGDRRFSFQRGEGNTNPPGRAAWFYCTALSV